METVCVHCNGEGIIVACCDDLCNGIGHCIHGDGEGICPVCFGEGSYDDDYREDGNDD